MSLYPYVCQLVSHFSYTPAYSETRNVHDKMYMGQIEINGIPGDKYRVFV